MTLFEDQWPGDSDLDFNDAVIAHNYIFEMTPDGRVRSMRATFNVLALGGVFNNGLGLRLPGVANQNVASARLSIGSSPATLLTPQPADPDNLTLRLVPNMRALFGGLEGTINSDPARPTVTGQAMELEVTFLTPQAMSTADAPFDLYIFRSEAPTHEVHRPQHPGTAEMDQSLFGTGNDGSTLNRHFVDRSGLPYALTLPALRPWPREAVAISQLYPNIVLFAASAGTQAQNFYDTPVDLDYAYGWTPPGASASYPVSAWTPPNAPVFVGPSTIPAVTGCVNAWGLSVDFGTSRDTYGYDSVRAPNGDVIITGYTTGAFSGATNAGAQDLFVARYSASGTLLWVQQVGGSASETGRAVSLDSAGNIYVVGETRSNLDGNANAGQTDGFLMKFNSAGTKQWTRTIAGSGYDYASGVAVDASGAIYVAGGTTTGTLPGASYSGNGPSNFLVRYDANGSRVYTVQYGVDPSNASNYGYSTRLAVDSSGGVYIVGSERRYNQSGSASENPFVVKRSASDGSLQWVQHLGDYGYYNGATDYRFGHAFGVDIDPQTGGVYVVGHWQSSASIPSWGGWTKTSGNTSADIFISKLDNQGAVLWSRSLGSSDGANDYALGVRSDASGNAYVIGYTGGAYSQKTSKGGIDYIAASFQPSGTQRWLTQEGTSTNDGAFAASINSSANQLLVIGNTGYLVGNPLGSSAQNYGFLATLDLATGIQSSFVLTATVTPTSTSCKAILDTGGSHGNGVYTVDPDGPGGAAPVQAYCDMTSQGGGWTLVYSSQCVNGNTWEAGAGYDARVATMTPDGTMLRVWKPFSTVNNIRYACSIGRDSSLEFDYVFATSMSQTMYSTWGGCNDYVAASPTTASYIYQQHNYCGSGIHNRDPDWFIYNSGASSYPASVMWGIADQNYYGTRNYPLGCNGTTVAPGTSSFYTEGSTCNAYFYVWVR